MRKLVIVGSCSTGVGMSLGGSGQTARRIFRGLRDRGHTIHNVGIGPSHSFVEDLGIIYHGCEPVEYPGLWPSPNYVFPLAETIARVAIAANADLLHAHYLYPWGWAIWQAQQLVEAETGKRIPIVQRPAGTDVTIHAPGFQLLTRLLLEQADATIISTKAFAREVAHISGLGDRLRFCQVYNPIPNAFSRGAPIFREAFGIRPEQVVIGIVGNFRPVKGALGGVDIFHRLVAGGVDAVLFMIGDGLEADSCRQRAAELGVLDRVLWLGRLDRMAPAYSSLDILLHPSAHESFGLVLGEAARCQVPAVASDVGGIPEVVADGETGFLCPSDDFDCFVARLTELARDRALRERMGRAACERAKQLFNLAKISADYENVFYGVINAGAVNARVANASASPGAAR